MNPDVLAWIAVLSLLATCFGAIAARSLHSFSRHELEQICEMRQAPDKFAEILKTHESVALGVQMVVMLLAALSVSTGSLWTWQTFAADRSQPLLVFLVGTAALGLLLGVATVWLP